MDIRSFVGINLEMPKERQFSERNDEKMSLKSRGNCWLVEHYQQGDSCGRKKRINSCSFGKGKG